MSVAVPLIRMLDDSSCRLVMLCLVAKLVYATSSVELLGSVATLSRLGIYFVIDEVWF